MNLASADFDVYMLSSYLTIRLFFVPKAAKCKKQQYSRHWHRLPPHLGASKVQKDHVCDIICHKKQPFCQRLAWTRKKSSSGIMFPVKYCLKVQRIFVKTLVLQLICIALVTQEQTPNLKLNATSNTVQYEWLLNTCPILLPHSNGIGYKNKQ